MGFPGREAQLIRYRHIVTVFRSALRRRRPFGGLDVISSSHSLKVVQGEPWTDALNCVLNPDNPSRPWREASRVKRGDTVVVVIATDPPAVLCAFTAGRKRRLHRSISEESEGSALPTVGEIEVAAGQSLADGLPLDFPAATALIQAIGERSISEPRHRRGDSSLAIARILLQSGGRCTYCYQDVAVIDVAEAVGNRSLHLASIDGEPDWPSLLCATCTQGMSDGGFVNVIDYAFSRQPPCPFCSAQRSRRIAYGLPSYSGYINTPPWVQPGGGCAPGVPWRCDACGTRWDDRRPYR